MVKIFWNWISKSPIRKAVFIFISFEIILSAYNVLFHTDYVISNPIKTLVIVLIISILGSVYTYWVERKKSQ